MPQFARTLGLGVLLTLKDQLTSKVLRASTAMGAMDAATKATVRSVKALGAGLVVGGAAFLGGLGIIKGLSGAVTQAAMFQKTMFDVQRTTGFTDEQIAAMGDRIVHLTAGLPVSANELARVAVIAGQLGISTTQGAAGVEQLALVSTKLARATNELTEEQAALGLGGIATLFKLDLIKQGEGLASAIVEIGRASRGTAPEILEIVNRVGPTARQFGISAEKVIGMAGALKDFGIQSEIAASAMTLTFNKMAQNTGRFARFFGVSRQKFEEVFSKDANLVLLALAETLGRLTPIEQAQQMKQLGLNSQEAARFMGALSKNTEIAVKMQDLSNKAMQEATALQEVFATQMKGLIPRLQILANNVKDVGIKMTIGLLPPLTKVVDVVSSFVAGLLKIPGPILSVTGLMIALTGVVVSLVGGLVALVSSLGLVKIGLVSMNVPLSIATFRMAAAGVVAALSATGMSVFAAATGIATSAVTALALAIIFNPLGALLAGVVAVTAALVAWTVGWNGVKDIAVLVFNVLKLGFMVMITPLKLIVQLVTMMGQALGLVSAGFDPFASWASTLRTIVNFLNESIVKSQQLVSAFPSWLAGGGEAPFPGVVQQPISPFAPGGGFPMMAEGGVAVRPVMAGLAERGRPELIAPLDSPRAQSLIARAAGATTARSERRVLMVTIPVELDGRVLARVVREFEVDDAIASFVAPVRLTPGMA